MHILLCVNREIPDIKIQVNATVSLLKICLVNGSKPRRF